jgi:hypothetical protein
VNAGQNFSLSVVPKACLQSVQKSLGQSFLVAAQFLPSWRFRDVLSVVVPLVITQKVQAKAQAKAQAFPPVLEPQRTAVVQFSQAPG